MPYAITTATQKIAALTKRIKAVQGGTSAGKTIGIEQILIDKCQRDGKGDITSIVSESFPHLKRGAMRDFLSILQQHNYYDDNRWNRSDFTYTFETGAQLEFFSADQPQKVRGPRRKRLFMNEANNMSLETFEQLEVRTLEEVYLDWNPTNEFWYYTDVEPLRDDCERIILTYKDNEALSPDIVRSIEQRKNRKGWWKVYGEGQLGEVEGKIYKGWIVIDEVPEEAILSKTGLDFGYSRDPAAAIDTYKWNGGIVLDEVFYTTGLSNKEITGLLKRNDDRKLIIADSSEPKSIDEIKGYGLSIVGAIKGPDSVNYGIQYVQDQTIYVTRNSVNLLKEYRNYLWMVDKNGKILTIPEGGLDHALDAVRYALASGVKENGNVPSIHYGQQHSYGNAININKFRG